ncbi:uncharacterized protein LOC131680747 [Topomyia yanbarensis]|uniref:uncharacterized protein LOC131680747 n=1 Tax=Topomyia yanbarensis TaxID=2498891 RepID=UPI00273B944B|nr:uncharacterized protein LOC131680747 [Topomyia yanbarensis]
MGNKLSPLLADVFLSDFKVALGKEKLFYRVWRRYVDDIFAAVKERYLTQTLDILNSRHSTIKFTVEKEIEGKLPFLDLMITRKADKKLKFGIYRKPTSTDRYIASDSNHVGAQEQSAFHSMAHRLFNVPMENDDFKAEQDKIYKAAELNGYEKGFVEKILRKHKTKKHRQNATTLEPDKKQELYLLRQQMKPRQTSGILKPQSKVFDDVEALEILTSQVEAVEAADSSTGRSPSAPVPLPTKRYKKNNEKSAQAEHLLEFEQRKLELLEESFISRQG